MFPWILNFISLSKFMLVTWQGLTPYEKKKYVWKMLYIYMLGYDVDFGHMEAVSLISAPKYPEKQVRSTFPTNVSHFIFKLSLSYWGCIYIRLHSSSVYHVVGRPIAAMKSWHWGASLCHKVFSYASFAISFILCLKGDLIKDIWLVNVGWRFHKSKIFKYLFTIKVENPL